MSDRHRLHTDSATAAAAIANVSSGGGNHRERIRAPSRDGRGDGLTSPRQVLRRLMLLTDGRQYREAAGMVGRLGPSVFRSVVAELPMDILLEALPHSAYLLETFYARMIAMPPASTEPRPASASAEPVLWQLVKLFANVHESGLRQRCSKLIQCICAWQPELRALLAQRRAELDQAVQGLGMHGLTAGAATPEGGALNSLHITLKAELHRHIDTYKAALQRIDELSSVTVNPDPAFSSHQRLLAIGYADIQQRLIDNKQLLTVLEKPALQQLQQLVGHLSARVQNDKEVLYAVGQIKRVDPLANTEQRPAAGLLMNFSRGCDTVLKIMGAAPVDEAAGEREATAKAFSSGDQTSVLKAPPSPTGSGGGGSDGYHSDGEESAAAAADAEMVQQYRTLYVQLRNETLAALDQLQQLRRTDHLKTKILFSIIVLAFRACHALRDRKLAEVRRVLCATAGSATPGIDRAVHEHLRVTADAFPTGDVERQVANQVLVTLHEYPCLETCLPLLAYISACVRLAWKMANHAQPYYLDLDFTLGLFSAERHVKHAVADAGSQTIRAFIWPALVQQQRCVFKAVVVT